MAQAFRPTAETITLACTAISASTTVLRQEPMQLRIYNAGPNDVFIRLGNGALTAVVATDMPIPAGAVEVFTKNAAGSVAGICAGTGTATVYLTAGEGE